MLATEEDASKQADAIVKLLAECPENYEWVLLGMIGRKVKEAGKEQLAKMFEAVSNARLIDGSLMVKKPPKRGTMNYATAKPKE